MIKSKEKLLKEGWLQREPMMLCRYSAKFQVVVNINIETGEYIIEIDRPMSESLFSDIKMNYQIDH